jgi:hypothetical protein
LPRTVAITEPVSECLPGLRNAERIRRVDADVLPSAIGRPGRSCHLPEHITTSGAKTTGNAATESADWLK